MRILITLNTRRSAQKVFLEISKYLKEKKRNFPEYFISSDVIPKERLDRIDEIKKGNPCIVVTTQSIEAGVDIDMDHVIRDFAPLDSLIQIAGRCNRNGKKGQKDVEIVQILSENGRLFCEMIYDKVHLQKTRQVLSGIELINEKNILKVTEKYFMLLMGKDGVNTGEQLINNFAYWKEVETIKNILRGKQIKKYEFYLVDKDPSLMEIIKEIQKIEDRWERRRAWKRISGRLAQISISVLAKRNFVPEEVAQDFNGIWILNPMYYHEKIGFHFTDENSSCLVL